MTVREIEQVAARAKTMLGNARFLEMTPGHERRLRQDIRAGLWFPDDPDSLTPLFVFGMRVRTNRYMPAGAVAVLDQDERIIGVFYL
jgi:hypothetical protein